MQDQKLEYAGFWVRVWASLIDTLLLLAVTLPPLVYIYGWGYFDDTTGFIAGTADLLISWVLPAVATIVFWRRKQATPGKSAMSLRILDAATGETPAIGQCIGRYLAYFVAMLPLGLGLIWVAFDRRKQGLHDKLAGTVVVRAKHRGPEPVRFGAA